MIEFLQRFFGRHGSGATAKERLRLVLMSDHLSLTPDMVDAMKRDLVDVISRYVEVDRERIDVHFEHQDKALAMLANIPILAVNRNGGGAGAQPQTAQVQAPQEPAPPAETPGQNKTPPENEAVAAASPRPKRKRKSRARKSAPASSVEAPAT